VHSPRGRDRRLRKTPFRTILSIGQITWLPTASSAWTSVPRFSLPAWKGLYPSVILDGNGAPCLAPALSLLTTGRLSLWVFASFPAKRFLMVRVGRTVSDRHEDAR